MIEVLGSCYETALRYMLLLSKTGQLTASKISGLDYIATYAQDFGFDSRNINGDNPYRFGEYAMRDSLCSEALKSLALRGTVNVHLSSNGLQYSLSSLGRELCKKFNSVYATDYRMSIESVLDAIGTLDEATISSMILNRINENLKEEKA